MYDKFFVGLDLTGAENNGKQPPISRVTLLLDDENSITAGDDTGIELVADCPHATQAMVNSILAQVKGHKYQMYSAENANLDPSAELGDGVTVDGIYSVISRIDDDGSGYAGLSAPGESELEEEYPSVGPMTQAFNRKIAETRSTITKTADEIRLEVQNEVQGLSASISVKLDSITSTVQGQGNAISTLTQKVDGFRLEVNNGSTSSTITLKSGSAEISSQTIQMNGLVTFTGLSSGTTTINGACIKTGTIDAERLNLTGAITFADLSSGVKEDINEAWDMAYDAQQLANDVDSTVSGWTYRGSTYIDGGQIMTGTVRASVLEGGEIRLLDARGREVGTFSLAWADSYNGRKIDIAAGAIAVVSEYGALYLEGGGGASMELNNYVSCGGDLVPTDDGVQSCGARGRRWDDIYCVNSEINTSDREKKKDISYGLDRFGELFDHLRPCSYRFANGRRVHNGLIAQDLEHAMTDCGVSDMDFAALVKSPRDDGGYDYGIRYGELIPLLIDQVQAMKKQMKEWWTRYGNEKAVG